MSEDKRQTKPEPTGQTNIFSLYGYPSGCTVTVEDRSRTQNNLLEGHIRNLAHTNQGSPIHIHPGTHLYPVTSGSTQNMVKTADSQPVTAQAYQHGPVNSLLRAAQTGQQRYEGMLPSSGQTQQLVGSGLTSNSNNSGASFPSSTRDLKPTSYTVGAAHPVSVSASQVGKGSDCQPINYSVTCTLPPEQLRSYLSGTRPGSTSTSSQGLIRPASTQSLSPLVCVSGSLPPNTTSLIQQGLIANLGYSQGSVSLLSSMPRNQAPSLSKPHPSANSSMVHVLPQAGSTLPVSSQLSTPAQHSLSEGGKRKSSRDGDSIQSESKQPRLGDRTVWDIGRYSSSVSVPVTTPQILTNPSPHSTTSSSSGGGGWAGTNPNSSAVMDSFRSLVQNSSHIDHSAHLQQTNSVHGVTDSTKKVVSSSGFPSEHGKSESRLEKTQKDVPQPQSQSFVEKMHATIFSLSEEASSSAPGARNDQSLLPLSNSGLASILTRVGRMSSSQTVALSESSDPRIVSSLSGQKMRQRDDKKPSPSSQVHSPQDSGSHHSVSRDAHSELVDSSFAKSDGDNTSSSEPESEHSECSKPDPGSKKIKQVQRMATSRSSTSASSGQTSASMTVKQETAINKTQKDKSVPLTFTNPCVSGSRTMKQTKTSKQSSKGSSLSKPLVKVSLATLKKTGAAFLQDGPCNQLAPKLGKCRECRAAFSQGNQDVPFIFCRFYAFRRLKYNIAKGTIMTAGFSELSDADPDHIEPWLPKFPIEEPVLNDEMAKFIISKVGDKFCELVQQERETKTLAGPNAVVAWKRAVSGVREMCDVCETTIFNMHWVCSKCGYVVCIDCYRAKLKELEDKEGHVTRKWQICTSSRYPHDATKFMLTQIIPSDALWELGRMIHDIRRKWSIPATCPCGQGGTASQSPSKSDLSQSSVKRLMNGMGEEAGPKKSKTTPQVKSESEAQGNGSNIGKNVKQEGSMVKQEPAEGGSKKSGTCTSLRELLTKTAGKGKVGMDRKPKPKVTGSSLNDIIQLVVEKSCRDMDSASATFKFLHYIPRLGQWTRELPIVAHSLTETSVLYPDVPHSWLCDGRLLRLHDPHHKGNLQIFQEQWKRGQPVMVSSVHKLVNSEEWKPEAFNREFGDRNNDLVNCLTGDVIVNHPMSVFWNGFECIEERLLDEQGNPMLLKLKDWPPGDDFSELLPSRFNSLMAALPLPEYTRRDGELNLASRLPNFLVRPDLGPKMYNAFGSAKFPKEATTNLHLDISDAVNVLVYVGVPSDGPNGRKEHEAAAVKAIDEAGCDSITKRRVREVHELPGALWQIYDAHDADKIRDFLNKVAKERGEEIEPNHDAIHDQSWYLDEELRDRLLKEYGVQGYTIVQCLGDSIFIPAGAPHQVRNLHSCIKVAEDFVSPEHLNHCFRLTQEFRELSETHTNHEDKLQVKNIIYHAVKDSIAVLRELDPEDSHRPSH